MMALTILLYITRISQDTPSAPLLPVHFRIGNRILFTTFKECLGLMSAYLGELFTPFHPGCDLRAWKAKSQGSSFLEWSRQRKYTWQAQWVILKADFYRLVCDVSSCVCHYVLRCNNQRDLVLKTLSNMFLVLDLKQQRWWTIVFIYSASAIYWPDTVI